MPNDFLTFFNALGEPRTAAAIQVVSAVVTVVVTIVLVFVTYRYMRLTARSVSLTEQHFLLSAFPRLKLYIMPAPDNRRQVFYRIDNLSSQEIKLLSVKVSWEQPPAVKAYVVSAYVANAHCFTIADPAGGTILLPPGVIGNCYGHTLELPKDKLTTEYLDLKDDEAADYLTLHVRCTYLSGVGVYYYEMNPKRGYSTRVDLLR